MLQQVFHRVQLIYGVKILGFTEDVSVVVTAKYMEEVEFIAAVFTMVKSGMRNVG